MLVDNAIKVSKEPQDVEANFTCDIFPIVDFYLDSGASSHVTEDHSFLSSFQARYSSIGVYTANGACLSVVRKYTLSIDFNESVKHV